MSIISRTKQLAIAQTREDYPVGSMWTNGAAKFKVWEVSGDTNEGFALCAWGRLTDDANEEHMMYRDELDNLAPCYA